MATCPPAAAWAAVPPSQWACYTPFMRCRATCPADINWRRKASHIEQQVLQETVGSQDQVMAAYGGFNHVTFLPNGEFFVRPVTLRAGRTEELNDRLMLFYTGIKRTASNVADSYVHDLDSKKQQMRILTGLVEEAVAILTGDGDLDDFGELLHEGWQCKRSLSAVVTNPQVDALYNDARAAGAVGGKLIGAGGGGFMLLYVAPEHQEAVKARLANLIHVPFRFDFTGSRIVYFDPEADYAVVEQARWKQRIDAFTELKLVTTEQAA